MATIKCLTLEMTRAIIFSLIHIAGKDPGGNTISADDRLKNIFETFVDWSQAICLIRQVSRCICPDVRGFKTRVDCVNLTSHVSHPGGLHGLRKRIPRVANIIPSGAQTEMEQESGESFLLPLRMYQ